MGFSSLKMSFLLPYNIDMPNTDIFIKAQNPIYQTVLEELKNGRKESHWIWFIFPQVKGLGHSFESDFFGIESLGEAKEYWNNDTLRERYLECCNALLSLEENNPAKVMGYTDSMKLRSSLTLFVEATDNLVVKQTLDKFYNGVKDDLTLTILKEMAGKQ